MSILTLVEIMWEVARKERAPVATCVRRVIKLINDMSRA